MSETRAKEQERTYAAGEVVRGLRVDGPLPEGWTPAAAVVLVKCLDDAGGTAWACRGTHGLSDEEILGVLAARAERLRGELAGRQVME